MSDPRFWQRREPRRTPLTERILARVLRAGGHHAAAAQIERELERESTDSTPGARR